MATTSKELVEILQKYTKPDDVLIWNYWTSEDFDTDENQPPISEELFSQVADSIDRRDVWDYVKGEINELIWDKQAEKGQE